MNDWFWVGFFIFCWHSGLNRSQIFWVALTCVMNRWRFPCCAIHRFMVLSTSFWRTLRVDAAICNLYVRDFRCHWLPVVLMLHSRAIGISVNMRLLSRKLDMNGLREAYNGQFLTMKLVFMIIPIARECSITHTKTVKTCLLISKLVFVIMLIEYIWITHCNYNTDSFIFNAPFYSSIYLPIHRFPE